MNRIEINGEPATAEQLSRLIAINYGHFTSMQVQQRAVRGLDFHLQRLDEGSRELFATPLPGERLRRLLRQALRGFDGAASVRINVYSERFDRERPSLAQPVDVMISVSPAVAGTPAPVRLQARAYERDLPQIKHVATFGLFRQRRLAQQAGYDDALFVDRSGRISEGSFWNIGFWDGAQVVWPQAPMLEGVSMQVLRASLQRAGIASVARSIALDDLPRYRAAFTCNANRVGAPVRVIDQQTFSEDEALAALLQDHYHRVAADPI